MRTTTSQGKSLVNGNHEQALFTHLRGQWHAMQRSGVQPLNNRRAPIPGSTGLRPLDRAALDQEVTGADAAAGERVRPPRRPSRLVWIALSDGSSAGRHEMDDASSPLPGILSGRGARDGGGLGVHAT